MFLRCEVSMCDKTRDQTTWLITDDGTYAQDYELLELRVYKGYLQLMAVKAVPRGDGSGSFPLSLRGLT